MSDEARPHPRHDPARRDRIIDACLDVVAERGVAGTSHRRVAAAAGVPLGSMTYHFTGMDELLREAFERFAADVAERYERRLGAVRGESGEAAEPDTGLPDADEAVAREAGTAAEPGTTVPATTQATGTARLRDAVVRIITEDTLGDDRDLRITLEIYSLAAREPLFRDLTAAWTARTRAALERHVDPVTARQLDALVEGLTLHRRLDGAGDDPAMVADAVDRILRGHAG